MSRSRNYCFTLSGHKSEEFMKELFYNLKNCTYVIYGLEIGKESNYEHTQGYMEFSNPKGFKTIKKLYNDIHLEIRKGTQSQAINYCKKEGKWFEIGTKHNQGERNDLKKLCLQAIEDGIKKTIEENDCNYQDIKTIEKYVSYCEKPRNEKPEVIWICGHTGSGKTKLAYEMTSDNRYVKDTTNKWFEGYDGNTEVILDDLRPEDFKFNYLLRMLDRYEMRVEYKGGSRQFKGTKIIITTIWEPENFYKFNEPIEQLLRRITKIINLDIQ